MDLRTDRDVVTVLGGCEYLRTRALEKGRDVWTR